MTREEIINCLDLAIQLVGDGGPSPFTDEEYDAMYEFLNELRNN
jgi:hypothetical protein